MFSSRSRQRLALGVAVLLVAATTSIAADAGAIGETSDECGIGSLGRINNAPLALDDEVWTAPDTIVEIDVTANDTDFDGDELVVIDVQPAGHGAAGLAEGIVSYSPGLGFEGSDVFVYVVSDGRCGTHRASVRVVVSESQPAPEEAAPEPPVAAVVTFTG